jgi:uncharacterized integral membrane protein (TIGR00698 family)
MLPSSPSKPGIPSEGPRGAGLVLVPLVALLCLFPFVPSGAALVAGVCVALLFGNPYAKRTRLLTPRLLSYSVVGLGAAMDLAAVGRAGAKGFGYTVAGIALTLAAGLLLGKLLGTRPDTSLLITSGTAICGGSAIAAVAPTIGAREEDVSVSLATVFLLNAVALVVFPPAGRVLGLSEESFGLWAALAIHDTSSVVGAALAYGPKALEVATTVKLARALWIVPLALAIGAWRSRHAAGEAAGEATGEAAKPKPRRPWFILGFVLAAALVTFVPDLREPGRLVASVAKRCLVVTLFLIGCGLTRKAVASVGARPFVQGLALWAFTASATLGAILAGWVR